VFSSRLDLALVERGIASSRTKAQRLIVRGVVTVNGAVVGKPSHLVEADDEIVCHELDRDVGRGALKLRAALERWGLPVDGAHCVDLGASTGGFTQVLLEAGASSVVAIDVGHDQLHLTLREDPRVYSWEGQSVLELTGELWGSQGLPTDVRVVVVDLSFVSLGAVAKPIASLFGVHSHYVLLVKPQFEVGRGNTTRGVVRDERLREQALRGVVDAWREAGVPARDVMCSPITGEKGNVEYLLYASATSSVHPAEWDGYIPNIDEEG
jgi:23S rRNA (cytidine1920-2'-O)/16S rRNA (cytidine1409-2'-O)-methyltransferase